MPEMTKEAFLAALKAEIVKRYAQPVSEGEIVGWATDPGQLARYMGRARVTIEGDDNQITIGGPAVIAAWKAIGGKGKPTFKALRALPQG